MKKKISKDKPGKSGKETVIPKKILGPVPDLEAFVTSDWWRSIFNSIYLKTDADVVEDDKITAQEVDIFTNILKLKPDYSILDLCCGQGRHTIEFFNRGFKNIEGLDRSHYLIQRAKSRIKKKGYSIKFKEGDARKLPYKNDAFDVVLILGNSFGYFETVQDDIRVLKEVFRVLKPWGKLLIDVTDGEFLRENYQPRSWEWIDKNMFVNRERSLSMDKNRLISREIVNHVEKGVIADQFYAERLYTKESLAEIIASAGLSEFNLHQEFTPDSKRNQDLGMMAKRLISTSVVRKEWTPIKKKTEIATRNVVVVLGDPSKTDALKPSQVFDDDDFYTIDQLKRALNDLTNYRFTYLNNHDLLVEELKKIKSKMDYVLNLCDEGFENNPVQELHVPAMLEIMNIPYTGSDPQCLAYCYDKSLVRGIASEMNIPVPTAFLVNPEDVAFDFTFDFPVIVKPNYGDSSFGITVNSVAENLEELLNAISLIREKFGYEKPILVEEFLTGKDLSLGIIGNPPDSYRILPIIEEDYSCLPEGLPRICGYEAKWDPKSPYWNITSRPAGLPDETKKIITECSLKLCDRLEVRDYVRFDWRLNTQGNPKLLEVNPNPGWCWDGHLAKMAKIDNLNYSDMLKGILEAAEQRFDKSDKRKNV